MWQHNNEAVLGVGLGDIATWRFAGQKGWPITFDEPDRPDSQVMHLETYRTKISS
jgi:hypothetical protein